MRLALNKVRDADVETRWSTATWTPADPLPTDPQWSGGSAYLDRRAVDVAAPPQALWRVVVGIGGEAGWYPFPLAWLVRGWVDSLGRRGRAQAGRRDPDTLYVGEALDFWRVEEVQPGHLSRLRAEMRLPGRAWLEMKVVDTPHGSRYEQRAIFLPRGLTGRLYWRVCVGRPVRQGPHGGGSGRGVSISVLLASHRRRRSECGP